MDRLDAMAAFVAVADLRGFAPAARRLGRSPSAITRLVASLEAHLDLRLLQRTTRSVALTDAGARYLERARRILADVDEAEAAAQAERRAPTGQLVVAAPNLFGRREVAPVMSAYLRRYPAVVGELRLSDANANLVEDGIDVAVRIGVLRDSSLSVRKVGETRSVIVGAPAYLRRRKVPRTPADLAAHDLVQFTGVTQLAEWRLFRAGQAEAFAFTPAFRTNSLDAAIVHAELGGGLAQLFYYQVADAIRAGRLKVVLDDVGSPPVPIQLVYPTTRLLSAKVRAFVDLVVATCDWRFV